MVFHKDSAAASQFLQNRVAFNRRERIAGFPMRIFLTVIFIAHKKFFNAPFSTEFTSVLERIIKDMVRELTNSYLAVL